MLINEIWSLIEGEAVFTFPEDISLEEFNEIKEWMALILGKLQRRVERRPQIDVTADPAPEDAKDE